MARYKVEKATTVAEAGTGRALRPEEQQIWWMVVDTFKGGRPRHAYQNRRDAEACARQLERDRRRDEPREAHKLADSMGWAAALEYTESKHMEARTAAERGYWEEANSYIEELIERQA